MVNKTFNWSKSPSLKFKIIGVILIFFLLIPFGVIISYGGSEIAILIIGIQLSIAVSLLISRSPPTGVFVIILAAGFDNLGGKLPFVGELSIGKVVGVIVILGWLLAIFANRAKFPPLRVVALPAIFVFLSAISGFWAMDKGIYFTRLQSLFFLAVIFVFVVTSLPDLQTIKSVINKFWLAGSLSILLPFVILILNQNNLGSILNSRFTGGIGDPNEFALYQLMLLPFTVYAFNSEGRRFHKSVILVVIILEVLAIIVSRSRAGLITLFTIIILSIVINRKRINPGILYSLLFLPLLGLLINLNPLLNWLRLTNIDTWIYTDRRFSLWLVALRAIQLHPLTGLGLGNFSVPETFSRIEETIPFLYLSGKASVAHNAYLQIGAELGIIGLLIFVVIVSFATIRPLLTKFTDSIALEYRSLYQSIGISMLAGSMMVFTISEQYNKIFWVTIGLSFIVIYFKKIDNAIEYG